MKALSLTQPWAEMILHHGKRIENRTTWKGCSYRGPVLLHAAKGVGTRDGFDDTVETILGVVKPEAGGPRICFLKPFAEMRVGRRGRHHADGWWAPSPDLKRGGIVGMARIDGVIRNEADFAAYAANVALRRWQRKWWFGGFALVLSDVHPLPFIPWKGALGLFEVNEDRFYDLLEDAEEDRRQDERHDTVRQ